MRMPRPRRYLQSPVDMRRTKLSRCHCKEKTGKFSLDVSVTSCISYFFLDIYISPIIALGKNVTEVINNNSHRTNRQDQGSGA